MCNPSYSTALLLYHRSKLFVLDSDNALPEKGQDLFPGLDALCDPVLVTLASQVLVQESHHVMLPTYLSGGQQLQLNLSCLLSKRKHGSPKPFFKSQPAPLSIVSHIATRRDSNTTCLLSGLALATSRGT